MGGLITVTMQRFEYSAWVMLYYNSEHVCVFVFGDLRRAKMVEEGTKKEEKAEKISTIIRFQWESGAAWKLSMSIKICL